MPLIIPLAIPSPDISYIDLGPLRIHFYALFILTGIAVAVVMTGRRLRGSTLPPGSALDVALWAVPFGIVGGRFYHVITHPGDYFFPGADLWKTLYVWEGGLAIFGAIIFGSLGAWIWARRNSTSFLGFADALAPGLLLAQAIGRIGNYFNQELFGAPTTAPWGLQIDPGNPAFPPGLPADTLFHPLFLYEMLWNLIGVAVILLITRRVRGRAGLALGLYFIWYGTGRAWLESFRLDPTELLVLGIKINILTAVVAALAGIAIIAIGEIRRRSRTVTSLTESATIDEERAR